MSKHPLSLAVLAGTLLAACGRSDPALARVGPDAIRASAFLKEVQGVPFTSQKYLTSAAGRKELLELLVRRKLMLVEAAQAPVDDGLARRLKELKALRAEGRRALDKKYFENRDRLLTADFMEKLSRPGGPLHVADEEINAFWKNESEVRASHILLADRAKADDIHARLLNKEDFTALAKAHSEDTGTAARGGDTGYLLRGSLVGEFEDALAGLKPGAVSDVVTSPYGYHIIRRTGERRLSDQPLDDALKTRIRQALQSQRLSAWFVDARRRVPVRTDDAALADLSIPTKTPEK
jgi:peptidyl-prolyl cis-trans isomerase C